MTHHATAVTNRPVWVDLASTDPEGSRAFYARLFGWQIEVNPDPAYGGYGLAKLGGEDVAGIGPSMTPGAPTVWNLYMGTADVADLARRVTEAGGAVVAGPMEVGDQGTMAVFRDPSGAFISAWQAAAMAGFGSAGPGRYGWAELNARGIERVLPFYESVFGWTTRRSDMGEGVPPYIEFLLDGESVAGGWEMNPAMPPEAPSYWMVYFLVGDVDDAFRNAIDAGATEMMGPQDFPGGRFAIIADPQGAALGLLRMGR